MEILEISNDHLIAKISTHGAELTSLLSRKSGEEVIWQADSKHWARHAPVLFPIVGKLQDNEFYYGDKSYKMGQHGFARDTEFKLLEHSKSSISLEISDSESTWKLFPFAFKLVITYKLTGFTLSTIYQVSNPASSTLYFSIGGHPAFNCPPLDKGVRSDFSFKFNKSENTQIQYLTDGVFAGKVKAFIGERIPIMDNLFDDDALVFESLKSDEISIVDKHDRPSLTFSFAGFPYLGLWSKSSKSPFVCIEPWFGIADTSDHDKNITTKKGIVRLDSESHFECSYSVTVRN